MEKLGLIRWLSIVFCSDKSITRYGATFLLGISLLSPLASEESREIEFKAFNIRPGNFSNLMYYDADKELQTVAFKKKNRTERMRSKIDTESNRLIFYLKNAALEKPTPVASTWVDPEIQTPLLIFTDRSSEHLRKYSIVVIEDALSIAPVGSIRIVNLTGIKIVGSIDDKIIKLKNSSVSKSHLFAKNNRVRVTIASKNRTQFYLLYRNTLSLNANARSLLILRPPKRRGSVKISGQLLVESAPD